MFPRMPRDVQETCQETEVETSRMATGPSNSLRIRGYFVNELCTYGGCDLANGQSRPKARMRESKIGTNKSYTPKMEFIMPVLQDKTDGKVNRRVGNSNKHRQPLPIKPQPLDPRRLPDVWDCPP